MVRFQLFATGGYSQAARQHPLNFIMCLVYLGVAKFGIALRLGRRDRGSESLHSDQHATLVQSGNERRADKADVLGSNSGSSTNMLA